MTVKQMFVQAQDYPARDDRLWMSALLPPGTAGPLGSKIGLRSATDLMLTMTGAQAGNVSKGACFIDFGVSIYMLTNDGPQQVTFGVADATNPRIDLVVARVRDAEAGGSAGAATIETIAGTPAAAPVAPVAPAGAMALYEVRYNAGSTNPTLTDRRASAINAAAPVGLLGYSAITADSGQYAQTVVPSTLGVTVTVAAGRRIRIACLLLIAHISGGATHERISIQEGATPVSQSTQFFTGSVAYGMNSSSRVLTPAAGSHAYQVWVSTDIGTSYIVGNNLEPSSLLIEDLGAV